MRFSIAAGLLLLLTGCASGERISLVANPYQQSLTRDGIPSIISTQKQVVMLRPATSTMRRGDRPTFVVAVYNRGKRPTELRVSDITASQMGAVQTAIHVYSYEELVAEVRRKQAWAAVGVALSAAGGAINAANAGYSRTYGTYSSGGYSGTYSATTYDAGRAYAAQSINNAQTAANIAAIQAQGQQRLSDLQNTILKDNTVMPGEWVGGIVVLDRADKGADGVARYQVDVRFGDELHTFAVSQARS